jgi:hypothetical protein
MITAKSYSVTTNDHAASCVAYSIFHEIDLLIQLQAEANALALGFIDAAILSADEYTTSISDTEHGLAGVFILTKNDF